MNHILKNPKSHYFLMSTFTLLLFAFTSVVESNAQNIFVCNKGSIPVDVAILRERMFFFTKIWDLEGWWRAEPNSWICPNVGGAGITQLVFRLTDNDGEQGIIEFDFDTSEGGGYAVEKICVKNERMEYSSSKVNFLPSCPEGFTAVPVSLAVQAYGNATLNLTVRPTISDYARIDTYFGDLKKRPNILAYSNGSISPACGYRWIGETANGDYRVGLQQGFVETGSDVVPADGYRWLNKTNAKDCSVEPIPSRKEPVKSKIRNTKTKKRAKKSK